MHGRIRMDLGHGVDIRRSLLSRPGAEAAVGNGRDEAIVGIADDCVLAAKGRTVAHRRRPWVGTRTVRLVPAYVELQQALDPVEALKNKLVSGIELDSRLSIDAVCAKLRTQLAFWLIPVTS